MAKYFNIKHVFAGLSVVFVMFTTRSVFLIVSLLQSFYSEGRQMLADPSLMNDAEYLR